MITVSDLRDFWRRLQSGGSVAVAGTAPAQLLGVRDGFHRYFDAVAGRAMAVAVVPQPVEVTPSGLPVSDEEALARVRSRLDEVARRVGGEYDFVVASDGGLHPIEIDGGLRFFIRCWAAVRCPLGEACGASGSIQLPEGLVTGVDRSGGPGSVPGTRRGGGMISALTGGAEDRRAATSEATFHALSTLFYGVLSGRRAAAGL